MKTLKISLIAIFISGLALLAPLATDSKVLAAEGDSCSVSASFLGIPTWYKYLDAQEDSTGRCSPVLSGSNPESQVNSALPIGLAVLEAMLRLAGMVAVVMIFVAGFRFITSDGSPEKAVGARKTVFNAIIGLAIVVLSTGLVAFIGSRLS